MNKAQHEKEDQENLVTVFETGNEVIITMVKSLLEEANIRYLAEDEGVGVGILGTSFNPIAGPVKFQVMPEDLEAAQKILKDIKE